MVRLDLEDLSIAVYSPLQVSLSLKGISHIIVGFNVVRLYLQGLSTAVYGCIQISLSLKGISHIIVGFSVWRQPIWYQMT